MRRFDLYNPVALAIYFLCAACVIMFSMDPILIILGALGAIVCFLAENGTKGAKSHLYTLLLFLVTALVNPLFSHNGVTVLFVMNDNPVTLEALIYGLFAAGMIVGILYRFRSFSGIMTSDKLIYIFGAMSPKLSLLLSMSLRYVPLFTKQVGKVSRAQKALGLYKEDNIVDAIRAKTRIFSVMVTWALENGIVTADSMTARGYGIGKRTQFSVFRWQASDIVFLIITLCLTLLTLLPLSASSFAYYPEFRFSALTPLQITGYASYAFLSFLPVFIQMKEAVKWRWLTSGI